MIVSLNVLRQLTSVDMSVDELVHLINRQLGKVEHVIDMGARYDGSVIVRIESCEKHPNADKLNVCMVDDGSGELVQVVCGAPNVHAGMLAVWLKPGSTVPSTATDKEPFVLGARELRGIMSNGMLASPKELGLGDSHDGILEIDSEEWQPSNMALIPGASFAQAYGLDDIILDIENKMFTHRPDLFGHLGVAREIAGIQGIKFKSPDWYAQPPNDALEVQDGLPLSVFNDAGDAAPRFVTQVVRDVEIKPSPLWLQCELVRMGGKPINNVVDATNYMMLLTAQPTHAYDYEKIRGSTLGVRMATENESIRLLNGKTYKLDVSDIVISDAEGPVGLAGIMGGGDSEVSSATQHIVLEVANFDMYTVRRTSMRHGVFTDALTRFNKGQSPYQNLIVLEKLRRLIIDIAGGEIASDRFDIGEGFDRGYDGEMHLATGSTTTGFINDRLGTSLTGQEIATLLRNVEFDVHGDEPDIDYREPFWRTDIVTAEDIVEEVGRLYGFDKLPRMLPPRNAKPASVNERISLKNELRSSLAKYGASEVLTYSFVHERVLTKSGQNPERAFKLSNALSPDLQYYRLSLTPSLLDKVHMNFKAGHRSFALFEFGKSHFKGEMEADEPDVPNEDEHLAFVFVGAESQGAAFYAAKRYFESTVSSTGCETIPLSVFDGDDKWGEQLIAPYDPDRSVALVKDGQIWGVIGEYTESTQKAFKLPPRTAGFEVVLDVVRTQPVAYRPLSRYPSVSQDISLKVPMRVAYADLFATARAAVENAENRITLTPIAIYQADGAIEKTVTFRITVSNDERTLTDADAQQVIQVISMKANADHDATTV